jgi:hypothetical protein
VRRSPSLVGADEHLQDGGLRVANQLVEGKEKKAWTLMIDTVDEEKQRTCLDLPKKTRFKKSFKNNLTIRRREGGTNFSTVMKIKNARDIQEKRRRERSRPGFFWSTDTNVP